MVEVISVSGKTQTADLNSFGLIQYAQMIGLGGLNPFEGWLSLA